MGFIVLGLTIWGLYTGLQLADFQLTQENTDKQFHVAIGLTVCLAGFLLILLGVLANLLRMFTRHEWNTSNILLIKKMHVVIAYIIIFVAQFSIGSGWYIAESNHSSTYGKCGAIVAAYVLIIGGIELFFRFYFLTRDVKLKMPANSLD